MSAEMRKTILKRLENLDDEIIRLQNRIQELKDNISLNELLIKEAELVREFLDLRLKEE